MGGGINKEGCDLSFRPREIIFAFYSWREGGGEGGGILKPQILQSNAISARIRPIPRIRYADEWPNEMRFPRGRISASEPSQDGAIVCCVSKILSLSLSRYRVLYRLWRFFSNRTRTKPPRTISAHTSTRDIKGRAERKLEADFLSPSRVFDPFDADLLLFKPLSLTARRYFDTLAESTKVLNARARARVCVRVWDGLILT